MKKAIIIILFICLGIIIYFFIKEQIKNIVLSRNENVLLSVDYLITGICIFILARLNFISNKKSAE